MDSQENQKKYAETLVTICDVLKELLEGQAVEPHENFFELGIGSMQTFSFIGKFEERCGIRIRFRDFFDSPTPADLAARLSGHKEIEKKASSLPRTSEVTRPVSALDRSLIELNYPEPGIDDSLMDRFQQVVAAVGPKLCIQDAETSLSYQEIDQLSNRIANELVQSLPPDESPILVYIPNGWQFVVTILGILKAGRIYVPIDTNLPDQRIELIRNCAAAHHVIETGSADPIIERWKQEGSFEVLAFDSLILGSNPEFSAKSVGGQTSAVLLFTSGSTGTPKGVLHNQSTLNHISWRRSHACTISAKDRYLMLYNAGYMGCINALFSALLSGASIHYYPLESLGLEPLEKWLAETEITIYHSVTSILRKFMAQLRAPVKLPHLRMVTPGGEASRLSDIKIFRNSFPESVTYMANLGSTECGSLAYFPITHQTDIETNEIPVGVPIETLNIKLLDSDGNEVEAGAIGEITIDSPFIFSGYWNDEEASTSDSEFHRPFRTGDFGRMDEAGRLINLGRRDGMIKINGYRADTTSIENALCSLDQITEGAVVIRNQSPSDNPQLYAFYCPKSDMLNENDLRKSLSMILPLPMVPSRFVALGQIPHTPNNKIDRKTLAIQPVEFLKTLYPIF